MINESNVSRLCIIFFNARENRKANIIAIIVILVNVKSILHEICKYAPSIAWNVVISKIRNPRIPRYSYSYAKHLFVIQIKTTLSAFYYVPKRMYTHSSNYVVFLYEVNNSSVYAISLLYYHKTSKSTSISWGRLAYQQNRISRTVR